MDKHIPKRSEENTTLTISLSRELRARIEEAAKDDKRKISPWVVIQLERILDELESESKPMLKVAEEARERMGSSPSIRAERARVSYPKKRKA